MRRAWRNLLNGVFWRSGTLELPGLDPTVRPIVLPPFFPFVVIWRGGGRWRCDLIWNRLA